MRNQKLFSRFEAIIQRVFEGVFGRWLGARAELQDVRTRLGQALEDSVADPDLETRTANVYVVHVSPADYAHLQPQWAAFIEEVGDYLVAVAERMGVVLPDRPAVSLEVDEGLRPPTIRVTAVYDEARDTGSTRRHERLEVDRVIHRAIRQVDAFLIIDGGRHVSLTQPVTTIGRRPDNDLVVESAAVSRKHAQVRWRYGHFIIYDLGSRAGTQVNGDEVQEYVLRPGDVINLSGTQLIYGEGATAGSRAVKEAVQQHLADTRHRDLPDTLMDAELAARVREQLAASKKKKKTADDNRTEG